MAGAASMASIFQLQAKWPSILFHRQIRLGSYVQGPCSSRQLDDDSALILLQCQDHWHQSPPQTAKRSLVQLKLELVSVVSLVVQMQY